MLLTNLLTAACATKTVYVFSSGLLSGVCVLMLIMWIDDKE